MNPALFFQFPVQLLDVQPRDAGDDLAAQVGLYIAPDVLLVAAQGVGSQGDGAVLLHPAVQILAQRHAAVLGELRVLIDFHVAVELGQQFLLGFGQHISEDGLAVFLMTHHDAALPAAVLPLAHHAVSGWSALTHRFNPPFRFGGRPGLSPPHRRSTDRPPPVSNTQYPNLFPISSLTLKLFRKIFGRCRGFYLCFGMSEFNMPTSRPWSCRPWSAPPHGHPACGPGRFSSGGSSGAVCGPLSDRPAGWAARSCPERSGPCDGAV